jgi:DNA-binding transcriptional ArsR family regulator
MGKNELLEENLLDDVSNFFKALGNSTRTQLLWSLSQGEMRSSELADILNMTPSAISHQLTLLKHLKIVSSRRDGKNQIYSLADDHISRTLTSIVEHYQED